MDVARKWRIGRFRSIRFWGQSVFAKFFSLTPYWGLFRVGAHVFFRGIRHNGAFQPLYRHLLSRTLCKHDARQTILGVRAYIPGDMPVDLQCLHTPYATSSLLPAPAPWPYIADFTHPCGFLEALKHGVHSYFGTTPRCAFSSAAHCFCGLTVRRCGHQLVCT